ncbi:MAG: DNA polymerase III subunit delta [Phycisphaerae bacterium]
MPAKQTTGGTSGPAVYAVFGPEAFLKRQAVRRITDAVLGQADRAMSMNEYEGPSAELAVVLDDLRTLPFLSDRRLVLVREADAFITRFRADLEAYLESPSPTGVLLLECKSLPANTRLYKKIDAQGGIRACPEVKANAIGGWLAGRAREAHGAAIEPQAAALLAELVGTELGLLDAELEKLALYVGDRRTITADDVKALVGQQREEEIWGIMSAIAAGDRARALTLWEEVVETDRTAEILSIAGIAFKVRQLLNAKRAQAAGASLFELGKMLMIWGNPQRVQAELSAFTVEQLERMLCRLLEADVAAKSGGVSVRASIEALIIEACRGRQRARAVGAR